MSTEQIYKEIRALPQREQDNLMTMLVVNSDLDDVIERIGYLRLTERAFDFWNNPEEDIYQDYANHPRTVNE